MATSLKFDGGSDRDAESWSDVLTTIVDANPRLQNVSITNLKDEKTNELDAVLSEINSLPYKLLQEVDFSRNRLAELPDGLFSHCVNTLEIVRLGNNWLEYLPSSLLECTRLKVLQVPRNRLCGDLHPLFFECLKELRMLNCDENSLVRLLSAGVDKSEEDLRSSPHPLRELSVAGNAVKTLENYAAAFPQLTDLNLERNKIADISSVDTSILLPPKLKTLCLGANPFLEGKQADKKLQKLVKEASASDPGSKVMKTLLATFLRGGDSKRKQKQRNATTIADDQEVALTELPGRVETSSLTVCMSREFRIQRPVWLGVVVRNMRQFDNTQQLGEFMSLQTKLQKNRKQICIGSHDFEKISADSTANLLLDCVNGKDALFKSLSTTSTVSAEEPETQKEQSIAACLQYWASENKAEYAKRVELESVAVFKNVGKNTILSVYPVSNCEQTKNTTEMQHCLIEVSGVAYALAEAAVDELLRFLVEENRILPAQTTLQRVNVVEHSSNDKREKILSCYGERLEALMDKFPAWMGNASSI